jgi:hypothetical protein
VKELVQVAGARGGKGGGKPAGAKKPLKFGHGGDGPRVSSKTLVGKPVKLFTFDKPWSCPTCSAQIRRGIVFDVNGTLQCSRSCAAKAV